MRRAGTFNTFSAMKVIRKIVSGKFLDIHLYSHKNQLAHVRIVNLAGSTKLSLWQEIYKGENSLDIDISSLTKGPYKINIDFPEENTREELFTIC